MPPWFPRCRVQRGSIGADGRAVGGGMLVGTVRAESVVAARVVDEANRSDIGREEDRFVSKLSLTGYE